jgi:hypothetical protein
MGSLMHDFYLMNRREVDYWGYSKSYNHPRAVSIHDDVMHYLYDSLKWIPCHFPERTGKLVECRGLNLIGHTIIKDEGAAIADRVLGSWADLFSHGPLELRLSGLWSSIDGEPDSGKYKTVVEDRNKLVSSLRQVSDYARRVSESESSLYILHVGI